MRELVAKLEAESFLSEEEFAYLLTCEEEALAEELRAAAERARRKYYGNHVFIRGLIEFTNYCRNDCFYCGIRRGNHRAQRYRLKEEQILDCCDRGYELGFRTFVLQGGEDAYFTDERLEHLIAAIKRSHPDAAVTLSVGERSRESYERLFAAGADRYLLRHETSDPAHYGKLHPKELSLKNRMRCLSDLKEIGYQVGCGFMVGSPGQTTAHLIRDLQFIHEFEPHMIGIGPFIPHRDTPFGGERAGSAALTLKLLGILRLMQPKALLPATTALGTLEENGREAGIRWGANVVMPNLSPENVREKYTLYDNKLCTGDETAEALFHLKQSMQKIGYQVVTGRGDSLVKTATRGIR